ncbi:MAG TPA: ankyrin repeat domain-containing protein [Gammaproteobacteria bacterium]|jgi:tRNA A-37 threonylcarbamoyl transferase component Bud32|nr:ankyrin repeat domain-containing protein [Gammaproteobacteria bacterium]
MVIRSKKRKREESTFNSKFDELIAKPMADFRKAIEILTADEMAEFIEYCNDEDRKSEVYYKLFLLGDFENIKRLSSYVNLKYRDNLEQEAVLRACAAGRVDVLRWLVDSKKLNLNVMDKEGDGPVSMAIWKGHIDLLHVLIEKYGLQFNLETMDYNLHPVMWAVVVDQPQMLLELIKPKAEGGFGLSPNVRTDFDYGLDRIATAMDSRKVLAILFKPRDQGGLGMSLDSSTFKMHHPEHKHHDRDIVYYNSEKDSIIVLNTQTGAAEIYTEWGIIGKGGYGVIHEYQCGVKRLVLKELHSKWVKIDDEYAHRVMLKDLEHEFKLLALIYPENGPYVLQQFNGNGKSNGLFSYRMIMPYIPGGYFDIMLNDLADSYDKACLLLRILEELQRIHDHGYIHGDIRKGNILIEKVQNGAVKDYKVRFIDFNFATRIGKPVSYFLHNREEIPPEAKLFDVAAQPSYDIYMLSWWLSQLNYKPGLSKKFPSICRLIQNGIKNNPSLRPELPEIIKALRADIAKYEANHGIHKTSQFGLFAASDRQETKEPPSNRMRR